MPTIGILSANSQVGTEVCLYLSQMRGIDVVPICRSELSTTLLRRCGLACRTGSLAPADAAVRLLADCDVVADFALPRGAVTEMYSAVEHRVAAAVAHARPGARYVFISSIMALGMRPGDPLRRRWISRTIYAASKRFGERLAFRMGRRVGREVYVLRLSQVHGELQEVTRGLLRGMLQRTAVVPAGPSMTVFVYSIAEALASIARGGERPGRYTLVSAPEWSWKEIHEHYCRRAGIEPDVAVEPMAPPASPLAHALGALRRASSPLARAVAGGRETLAAYILRHLPDVEARLRSLYHRRTAAAEIAALRSASGWRPYAGWLTGDVPGARLRGLSDSRATLEEASAGIRRLIERAAPAELRPREERISGDAGDADPH